MWRRNNRTHYLVSAIASLISDWLKLHKVIKMQKSLPNQIEALDWISKSLAERLLQAVHNEDWTGVLVISKIINTVLQHRREIRG